jgi:hypothetical protein
LRCWRLGWLDYRWLVVATQRKGELNKIFIWKNKRFFDNGWDIFDKNNARAF